MQNHDHDDAIKSHLINSLSQTADALLFEGTNPWELDEIAIAHGFRMGPCELQDLVGLDTIRRERAGFGVVDSRNTILDRMVREGRLGKKVGVGWYRYPGGGGCVIDPLVEDLVREESYFAKVDRREINDREIELRLRQSLIKEAQRLVQSGKFLAEGINRIAIREIGLATKIC